MREQNFRELALTFAKEFGVIQSRVELAHIEKAIEFGYCLAVTDLTDIIHNEVTYTYKLKLEGIKDGDDK